MNTKIEGWHYPVSIKVHKYLTHYGFTFDRVTSEYIFKSMQKSNGHPIFTFIYNPTWETTHTEFNINSIDDYQKCQKYVRFYKLRIKYLRKKGIWKQINIIRQFIKEKSWRIVIKVK